MATGYDAIVVGAGIGGLYAAAALARRGQRVLVLERHDQVGGYASKFRVRDFEFDVSLHLIGDLEGRGAGRLLRELGVLNRVKPLKPRYLYESLFDGERLRLPNGDPAAIERAFAARFPRERRGIQFWFYCMRAMNRQVSRMEWGSRSRWRVVVLMLLAPLLIPLLVFGDAIPQSFALGLVRDRRCRGLLNQLWGYYGLPEARSNILFPMMANYGYYYGGGYYLGGGGQQLCLAFQGIIEQYGGEVRTRAPVRRILLEGDRVAGVELDDGSRLLAPKVIASANPFVVYRTLLADWPGSAKALAGIEKLELSISACVLYLGLDAPIASLWPEYADSYELFVNGDLDREAEYQEAMATTLRSEYRDLSITLHTNIDPSAAPSGKAALNVFVPDNLARWTLPDKDAYRRQKESETRKLLDAVERVLPGLRAHVEVLELATPVTMRAYTGNEGGALYGFSQKRGQSGPVRRFRNRGPIPGLYFASAWSFPGGGYEGAIRAGQEVAAKIV